MTTTSSNEKSLDGIAIIGMAGKFPGVENIYEYWEQIKQGKTLLTRFSKEELLANGLSEELLDDSNFVPVSGIIKSAEFFDSSFFGFTPREADLTDPQHRKFLEVCYEALENSSTSPDKYKGKIGVFAGCSMNNYLLKNLLQYPDLLKSIGEMQTIVNNDKDFLTTKVSYKLNLTGPSFDIQTGCSTSLVAIHVACQNLLNYQCDIALGGGVHLMNPRNEGYMFTPGSIESPDGTCRPFDKDAQGTIFSEGLGVVVLKRLEDAVADKDEIWAVIKSSALNNDGSVKVGYLAPSIDGQAEVISLAQKYAEIDPRTIAYIETHGTGTNLGDPIEIKALSNVFRESTNERNFCAIGSVKGNIGHCDAAAGVAGLIKTVMALKYKILPPSINFEKPNPELFLDESPFYVNTKLQEWESSGYPRRAAVSSFGFGGTNAHCILEEWNSEIPEPSNKEMHLLPLSAKSPEALNRMIENLEKFLEDSSNEIGDIAYTLQNGRNDYSNRALIYGKDVRSISQNLKIEGNYITGKLKWNNPGIVFMFTGQGSQYINMGKGLYDSFELFRNIVDEAHNILSSKFHIQLKTLLFNNPEDETIRSKVNLTSNTQPLLFVIQYATACLLTDFGIYPDALIGHSIGELTAATLSGVFTFEDALIIVASRGKIMQEQIPGSMLSVNLSAEKLGPLLTENIEISLQNAPNYCVVSGEEKDIIGFESKIKSIDPSIHTTILKTSHAFHSRLMEPALEPFKEVFKTVHLGKPEIPFISNVTGKWITDSEAINMDYWARHIRSTVQFSKGINQLLTDNKQLIFLEVGPGNSLSVLLSQFEGMKNAKAISTIRHPMVQKDDVDIFMQAIADFWTSGGTIRWDELFDGEHRNKVALPTYPFEKKRHWLESKSKSFFQEQLDSKIDVLEVGKPRNIADLMHDRPNLPSKFINPVNELEIKIVTIWQQLLGINEIGTEDDFFALGGHSLLASQVIIRINELLQVKLPFESLFTAPTIKSLISTYNLYLPKQTQELIIEHVQKDSDFPLSNAQKRLWILDQIEQNNPAYNISFTNRLKGFLDIEVFQTTIKILFDRHQILKSTINIKDKEPVCRILDIEPKVELIDLSKFEVNKIENFIQDFIKKDLRKPFDINIGPLYKIFLFRIASDEFVFHFNVHHIVFDGWSWGIFSQEINSIYNSLINNTAVSLPSPELQYYDFSNWQLKQDEPDWKKSVDFWVEQLKGIPTELKFPYDYKRPPFMSGYGGRESIRLSNKLSGKLKEISRKTNSTLFMTMLSSFEILMSIYSNEEDICIGAPVANRTKSAFEKIIGFFVNTIVFRLKINKTSSFNEILDQNKKVIIESLEHQNIPFEKLVDVIQPERQVNINPIYQVMFAWQNAPRPPIKLKGISSDRVLINEGVSSQDITFYMWENEDFIEGEIEFSTDIIERDTINRLKDNFIFFLEQITENPEEKISEISVISERDKNQLAAFNNTEVSVPECLVSDLFEKQVVLQPTKIAVKSGNLSLTYKELNEKANQIARHLLSLGVQSGDIVGISLERSADMVVSVLSILKAGCCYLPMDPSFPIDRLSYMFEDSGAKVLISQSSLKDKYINFPDSTVVLVDLDKEKISKNSVANPGLQISNQSLAYILYTSGSTGKPKGVKVHHQAVVNFLNSMSEKPGITVTDRLLAVTTLSFDISVLEIFLPLSCGAELVIADSDDIMDGKKLIGLLERKDITVLQATPATWHIILSEGWNGKKNLKALCGGEALPSSLVKELLPKVACLWNMYGPTETTVWSTCYQITDSKASILIGKPINNTTIHILDGNNKQLPVGVIGEVGIGGLGVTKGYHNRPELTAEKFIQLDKEGIIYKTGDQGRYLKDGNIELYGRIDNQIKLRGFRIEPGEIESLLTKLPGVKEAVVKVHRFEDNDERLVAFLNSESEFKLTKDQIKEILAQHLPSYMIPSFYQISDGFARLPNGKIDKKQLNFLMDELADESNPEEKMLTPIEQKLFELWADTLKIKNFTIHDNFFDIGGNSLLTISLASKIEKQFEIDFNIRNLFSTPRIKDLAELIDIRINSKVLDNNQWNSSIKMTEGEI
jgi:amino acid adenylation domain-containing protein